MREISDRCNICKRVKADSNHWLLMRERQGESPTFLPWDEQEANHLGMVCSEGCAHSALGAWLADQQALRRAPASPSVVEPQYPEASSPYPDRAVDTPAESETSAFPETADPFPDIPF